MYALFQDIAGGGITWFRSSSISGQPSAVTRTNKLKKIFKIYLVFTFLVLESSLIIDDMSDDY